MSGILVDWGAARRALAQQTAAAVVGIDRGRGRRFSAIAWDSRMLVTAAEALEGADAVTVRTAHGAVAAEILACDVAVDIAVLRAETGAPEIVTANPSSLAAGDAVLIAGRAESDPIIRWTQVEQVGPAWRSRSGGELDRLIRLAPGLRPALEGGGVFDLEGRLCAMAVRGPRLQTLGIPSETLGRVVALVARHGRLPQPYLGVRLQPVALDEPLRRQLSAKGSQAPIVVGIEADSPAAGALFIGDLILEIAGQPIDSALDLKSALSRLPLGAAVGLRVHRAGAGLDTTVMVRERGGR